MSASSGAPPDPTRTPAAALPRIVATPPTPLPAGYRVRGARRDDLDEIVAVVRAAELAVGGETTLVAGEISSDWADRRVDLERDTWVGIAPDDSLAAYAFAWGADPSAPIDLYFDVNPRHAAAGLDGHMLGLLLARAREFCDDPDRPEKHRCVALWCDRRDAHKRALLDRLGVVQTRVFLRMVIAAADLPPRPAWPAGITVRTFRPGDDDTAVHAATEEAFAEHFHFSALPFDVWQAQILGDDDFDPDLFLIARDGDEVAGVVLCFPTPDAGIVDQLAVRRPWRGRGLGRALLLDAMHRLADRGHERLQLGVDARNATGAARLYESVGMRVVRVTDFLEGRL